MSGKIPIRAAQRISDDYDCPIVIVFGLHDGGENFSVTTYGKSKALCRHAASLGSQIAEAILGGKITPVQEEPMHLPNVPTQFNSTKP